MRGFLALALLGLVLTACGTGARLSRADYARRADALCTRYSKGLAALERPTSLEGLAAYTAKAAPLAQHAVDEVRRLRPPRDEQRLAHRWIAESQKVVDAFRRLGDAARRNDDGAARAALAAGDTANTFADDLARELGMVACARV